MSKGDSVEVFYRRGDRVEKVRIFAERNGESIDVKQPAVELGETMLVVTTLDKNKNARNVYMFDRASVLAVYDLRDDR